MARLEEACDVDLYEGEPLSRDALAERVRGKQALVPMFTDPVDATVLEAGSDLQDRGQRGRRLQQHRRGRGRARAASSSPTRPTC